MTGWTRRRVLGAGAAGLLVPSLVHARPRRRSRLVLLGTKGGPTPNRFRAPASNLLVVDGEPYVIDAPDGVASRLVQAGIDLARLRNLFVTHNHSDHNAGLGALLILAWGSGLQDQVDLYGPAPLRRLVAAQLAANAYDIQVRRAEEGRPPLAPLVRVHEISAGPAMARNGVRVRCALADHLTVPNYAYRFDTPDRSFVFSGDTRPSEALIALARGADVLVHEVMLPSALGGIVDRNAPRVIDHILRSHTTTEELGRVAAAAGVRTLVLSHLVPAFPSITDDMWLEGARRHFSGEIIVGRDMMEL
ncbi:MAG TPA: MBL fold metallo-hydrolase [Allosphingosinicella sp.]|nr:MBL fold metallo-hydrolase [Allosphingosinicella sp.]